ncbi:MAG: amidase [Burkholderiaceae bacterium]
MQANEIMKLDARALSAAIRAREVSCREVMQATLARIERLNPAYNAIVSMPPARTLLAQADERDAQLAAGRWLGWMHGMPQAIKDVSAARGIPNTWGSPLYRDNVPAEDGIIVERVRRAGAIVIGKTNVPEFGLGSQTYNTVFGATRNAYDPSRCAGGSSGGAAVALALRMLAVADGSDVGGSLRNPAAFNNVYGFRPTQGRVPRGPAPEVFLEQFGTEGPMARNVADLALLLSVQAGHDARVPLSLDSDPSAFAQPLDRDVRGLRVGWLGDLDRYLPMEPGVLELCRHALGVLESLGCAVDAARLGFAPERLWDMWITLRSCANAAARRADWTDPARRAKLKPECVWEIETGLARSVTDLYAASAERSAWYRHVLTLFERFDFLVLPSAQVFPFDVNQHWPREVAGRAMDTYHRWMEVVIGPTLAGLPAISVPVGFDARGLPMGMQLIGRPRADLDVLQLAHAYDRATGWAAKSPPPAA